MTILLTAGILFFFGCKSKPAPAPVTTSIDPAVLEKMWKSIDSLEQKGLATSALQEVRQIKQIALAGGESGQLIKAVMHENRYLLQLEEDAALKAIQRAEQEMKTYPEPAKSVMHSLTAQWYHNYLQTHLWELRNRTEFGGPAGEDMRTWGIRHFVDKVQSHYTRSVQWEGLKTSAVKEYLLLLTDEKNTDALRPTLYDILMHRAIDYFAGTETYLTRPVYDYVLTDQTSFASIPQFVAHNFTAQDSTSMTLQTLHWFQQLLAFRSADPTNASALLDADLKRLRYVHEKNLTDAKDSLYQAALASLKSQYSDDPESALVDYYRAEFLIGQASQWQNSSDTSFRYAYNEALEICEEAIRRFPDAYGSQLCKTLIQQIGQKSVSASVESINLPNEELLAKLEYRNLTSVHLMIVKLPDAPRKWRGDNWDGDEMLRRLTQLPAVKTWVQNVDSGSDHQVHSTEIALPGLPLGHYALLVSDQDNFNGNKATSGTIMFTVSELAYWYIDDKAKEKGVAVINRDSGLPVAGVKVEFLTREYNAGIRKQEEIKIGEAQSDANGWVLVPESSNRNISFRLTKGQDELYTDDSYYSYRYPQQNKIDPTTLFFTDRAIYRPGQKIYFKGYALDFDQHRMPAIVKSRNIDVILYDANGQEVTKQSLRSNEYGTFFGHFDIPSGGLTGMMSISSSHGNSRQYFRVEEYKRPKFEVTFDTLRETVRLNDEVVIRGLARDYAGSVVSGAAANYRVERVAFRPWWYGYKRGYWPFQEASQMLVMGATFTKEDGSIEIPFQAKATPGADPDLMYRFEITVGVTDVTGEFHEVTKSIVLNRQGYEVNINLPERVSLDSLKEVSLASMNSDGASVRLRGEVEVISLKGPTQNKRIRLWDIPDIHTIAEADYALRFSDYDSPAQAQMEDWPTDRVVGKKATAIDGAGKVDISSLINAPGFYRIQWTWKDETGKELVITQHIVAYAQDKLLPGFAVAEVTIPNHNYEPGDDVQIKLLTGLTSPPKTIRVTERRMVATQRSWHGLPSTTSIKVAEDDRGGMIVHHLTAYNNRFFHSEQYVNVPWTNKELSVALKTWRDKLEPGDEETWTLTVEGQKQEKVAAELVLSMYDASLDAFVPHQWRMSLYPTAFSKTEIQQAQPQAANYWGLTYHWDQVYNDVPVRQYRDISVYGYYPEGGIYAYPAGRGGREYERGDRVAMMKPTDGVNSAPPTAMDESLKVEVGAEQNKKTDEMDGPEEVTTAPPLRSALDETVFFYPQINTDDQGRLTFSFKMKEGLTRWKFQALAHTKELAFGLTETEVVTQKQLMVFPNPPRFFREGDTIAFQAKVTNLTEKALTGKASLRIIDAFSDQDVSSAWGIQATPVPIQIAEKGITPVAWMLSVPQGWNRPVKYQVSSTAGPYTDGEESLLPVVTNRVLITETLPLPIKANETRTFVFKSMLEKRSATAVDHQFVVEMTTSPAWYAVQALPYLMEYPHECAEQVFSRLYANTLASHIAGKYPAIKQVYDAWRVSGDDALLSNLEKNKELKSAMLEETPWVRDAMGETRQKKDIALLFETNRLRNESKQSLDQLRQMQMSNGGFPWFAGGRDSWYITQYIIEGFGHLNKMGVVIPSGNQMDIIQKAVPYLDARMVEWYDDLKREEAKGKLKMSDHHIGAMQVHYLYTRSFFPDIVHPAKLDEIKDYLRSQIEKYWLQHGIYDQGLMALGSFRTWPEASISKEILASLRERTILHEELGRYWKLTPGFHWSDAAVELQSLMVELFQDMGVAQAEVDELRVWLLKQKQTTQWKTTKATASAIYALLIHPDTWLQSVGIVEVRLGETEVIGNSTSVEGGTGYVKKTWSGDQIRPEWSSVTVRNPNAHIAWGSAYRQYWEDIDKVKAAVDDNPLKVSRSLLIVHSTDQGEVSTPAQARGLQVGDKLIVRLTIETDRAMEFVHLKDLRASGFEPLDVLSGYRWGSGLGYYQSTLDLATHFFIDYLPRGKYVIEYPVTVAQAGAYSEGLATLQCMYAPEFGGHSEGKRVLAGKQ